MGTELIVEDLRKFLDKKEILKGVSFRCRTGQIIAILGPNGAGKTTTFLTLAGFYKPDGGKMIIRENEVEKDITALSASERARVGIAYLPQESSLFEDISVNENFKISCELAGVSDEKMDQIVQKFGISELMKRKVSTLSGGEKRKVEIARISLLSPKFLVLDEPFSGIDPKSTALIATIIGEISKNAGVIISDHNVRDVLKICSRVYIIYEGRIVEEGTPYEIVESRRAKTLFFGDTFEL